jgi:predicted lipopolysaccharide heptosyltransferase III
VTFHSAFRAFSALLAVFFFHLSGALYADFSLAKIGFISYTFNVLPKIQKILIIKLRAIGDVVLATPVIENLRAAFPEATIDFLTETPSVPVVKANPHLNRVLAYPRQQLERLFPWKRLLFDVQFLARLRRVSYDLVFDLFGNPRSAFMTWVAGAQLRVGFDFRGRKMAYNQVVQGRGAEVHEVEFNLDALRALEIPIRTNRPKMWLRESDREEIRRWLKSTGLQNKFKIAVNPSGSWPAKRWPHSHWVALGKMLVQKLSAAVVVLWGPGERDEAEKLAHQIGAGATLAPATSLRELAALCEDMALTVSNDAGPMHISAAVGTPTIGLYGPTNAHLQGPFGERNRAVANWKIPCLGCNRLTCPIGDCMHYLTPQVVFSEIEEVLQTAQSGESQKIQLGGTL